MSLVEQIFAAGIVGCGGAGFPTHAKYQGHIEIMIINGGGMRTAFAYRPLSDAA